MTTNYSQFQQQLYNQVAAVSSDTNWATEFPLVIDRAEQRIYRDLDLLGTRVTDSSAGLIAGNRNFTLPTDVGAFVVVEQVTGLFSTSSQQQRYPVVRASPQFIDWTWPSNSSAYWGPPEYFAMIDGLNIIVGPYPDVGYGMEIRGTQRPQVLSSGNSSTILTQTLPDLFFAAAMVEAGSYMRFTEPTIFTTWLGEYTALLKSATVEEQRKRFMMEGWVDKIPSPAATPPRQ